MIHFGTGGWRAVIGDEFTKANICLLARGMADKINAEGKAEKGIVIGYDRRFLSKETVCWVCEIMAAEKIHVHFVNRSVPTPLIMHQVMKYEYPYGMMVTASHNPAIYNGIKVFTAGGRDADEKQTKDIEGYIERVDPAKIRRIPYEEAREQGWVTEYYPMNDYVDDILKKLDMEAIKKAGLRIALDPMYGVSETALATILITGRCDLSVIHKEHDTLFGGKMPAPAPETMGYLQNYVLDKHWDLGVATDGDADRLGVVDDKGEYLDANEVLLLLYYYLVKYKGWQGPAVRNIATTHRLDTLADRLGQKCYEVPVGFKYISAKMMETGAILGGESSGGSTVAGHIHGKDGVYSAALITEMLAVTGRKLSELRKTVDAICGQRYMQEDSLPFPLKRKEELKKLILEDKKMPYLPYEIDHVSYMDGCKVYFKNGGWVIARFSGTEPLLRIFSEMQTLAEAVDVCERWKNFLGLQER